MNENAQHETPHVGIFWVVQATEDEARLLAAGCPLAGNTLIGPEYPNPLAAVEHILTYAEGILVRVAHDLCQKGRHISTLKPSNGRQRA